MLVRLLGNSIEHTEYATENLGYMMPWLGGEIGQHRGWLQIKKVTLQCLDSCSDSRLEVSRVRLTVG